jgi:hypothetical protein
MGLEKIKKLNVVNKAQIKHHSYVDIMGLLKGIPAWLNQMGYYFYEKGLSEKDIGSGDQIDSEWFAIKEVTEYYKFSIEISITAKDIRKIIIENGEETYWGRVLIIYTTTIEKDYQGKFDDSIWYEKLMREWYDRFILKDEIKRYIGKLAVESGDLAAMMKSHLK